ncbi:MAG: SGNH/GDSL hydrolase family protein [Phycisphaerales bacterium]|nr:SGNH/GDSL hydrolase family protein [Phycisphaerales bacterium]
MRRIIALVVLAIASLLQINSTRAAGSFFLHDGDRVCFYGDSITEQRFYPVAVETYVLTRFPKLKVDFVDSGVGGDRVTGGWAGNINERLKRDVYPFKPTVVTIMLGMNDASYRPFDQKIFDTYKKGYLHIVDALQKHLPGVRIVILGPSPFDDITQKPRFSGGYNAVLQRYDQFDKKLAAEHHLYYVDFNAPMVDVIKKLQAAQPQFAGQVVPGRVHPSPAGELLMAAALLKLWQAPATVSRVSISGDTVNQAVNTHISNLRAAHGLISWTQLDQSLPFPMLSLHAVWPQFFGENRERGPQPNFKFINEPAAAIIHAGHLYRKLDHEILQVKGLAAEHYKLTINDQPVGIFSATDLATGINLAKYRTPMLVQAYHILAMAWDRTQMRFYAWRQIQLPAEGYDTWWGGPRVEVTGFSQAVRHRIMSNAERLAHSIYSSLTLMLNDERAAAVPATDHYELTPVK